MKGHISDIETWKSRLSEKGSLRAYERRANLRRAIKQTLKGLRLTDLDEVAKLWCMKQKGSLHRD